MLLFITGYLLTKKQWNMCGKLRLRYVFVETDQVCHVWCNFTCRSAVIFGTLKDDSLGFNILATKNCFSHRNFFQNGINTLLKIVNQFLSKSTKFCMVRTTQFCLNFTVTSMWSKYLSNNVWREFRLAVSASAIVT